MYSWARLDGCGTVFANDVLDLRRDRRKLNKSLRVLKSIEWSGSTPDSSRVPECPYCKSLAPGYGSNNGKHKKDCQLKILIGGMERKERKNVKDS